MTSHRILELLFYAALFFLLSACQVTSTMDTTSTLDTPKQWGHFASMPLHNTDPKLLEHWWTTLHDETLNQIIVESLNVNNTIKEAHAHVEQAQGELKAIELSWLPPISAYAGYTNSAAWGSPYRFYGLWPEYLLLNIFTTAGLQKSAGLHVAVEKHAVHATQILLIGQIATSYYTYLAELEEVHLMNHYLSDLREAIHIERANYQHGLSSEIEIKTFLARLGSATAQLNTIQENVLRSQNALHYLLNQNPGPLPVNHRFANTKTFYPNIYDSPATVLVNRDDVAIAKLQYQLAIQDKTNTSTSLLPAFRLDYFGGYNGSKMVVKEAYLIWTLDPTIFGQMDALNAAQKAAYYNYLDTVKKALRDVDNDLIQHQVANERYGDTYQTYHALAQKYDLALSLYHQGISSYQATLESKLDRDEAAIAVNQSKLWQMITLINLYQDLEG